MIRPSSARPGAFAAAIGLLLVCVLPGTVRGGDVAAGKDAFRSECSECHSISKGRNKKGPSLFGIVGRPAGSLPDYHYTDALRTAHWTWTEDKLRSYLSQRAKTANPGTRMKFDGINDPQELDDLISFLKTVR
ncbi:MAG TPA: c-type cytochrome [Rhodanobacteraceae bacterium]|nr:c-type cytochrome [Rhodanobacteraceae bacterium]